MTRKVWMGLLLLVCGQVVAAGPEEGHVGFSADVDINGIFSPEVTRFEVTEVWPDSPAEKAGLKAGQQIISLDGCDIPGCGAYKAKDLMDRLPGDTLPLRVRNPDGSEQRIDILVEVVPDDLEADD